VTRNARRAFKEAWWILLTWCGFCAWVLLVCAPHFQTRPTAATMERVELPTDAMPVATVGGLPAWVFWGIALPWIVASAISIIFSLRYLQHEPAVEQTDG
jgi:hypothetical protein